MNHIQGGTAIVIAILVLSLGLALAQGPQKDVGKGVPLPPLEGRVGREKAAVDQYSLSIDVDLVTANVVVTDKRNNPISGLRQENFKVFENDVEQRITNFSPNENAMTVVLLLEFSHSFGYFMDDVVRPAAGFVNSLRANDWAALVVFDIRPHVMADFTKDKNVLFNSLRRLGFPGFRETALYDAVYDMLDRMEEIDGKKVIFLVSTGLDTISRHNYTDTLKRAEASSTVIYAVSMGQLARAFSQTRMAPMESIEFYRSDNVMRSLAEATGGVAFFPRFIGQYATIYDTVIKHLRNQYSVGFVPSPMKRDGKFHKIKIVVDQLDVDHDGKPDKLKVRHKKGYRAPKS